MKNALRELRLRSKRDQGFVLLSTMAIFLLIISTVYVNAQSSGTSIKNSYNSRDFIQSGQLSDYAIQDALYRLNEDQTASGMNLNPGNRSNSGAANDGTWRWTTTPVAADGTVDITGSGKFRGTTRTAEATAGMVTAGPFHHSPGKGVSYTASPEHAFGFTVFGYDVTLQDGVGASGIYASGPLALTGDKLNLTKFASGAKVDPASVLTQYGQGASKATVPATVKSQKAAVGLTMDSKLIDNYLAACTNTGTSLGIWKASVPRDLALLKGGSTLCFSKMDFDAPVNVTGTGAFNAIVLGPVRIDQNISTSANSSLNILTKGTVDFYTESSAGTTLQLRNTYIFAPTQACRTQPFRSTVKRLDFQGSLACNIVNAAGKFAPGAAIARGHALTGAKNLGGQTYANRIWYLTGYQQGEGDRD